MLSSHGVQVIACHAVEVMNMDLGCVSSLSCLSLIMKSVLCSHAQLSSMLFVFPCSAGMSLYNVVRGSFIICQLGRSTPHLPLSHSFTQAGLLCTGSLFKVDGSLDILYSKVLRRKFSDFFLYFSTHSQSAESFRFSVNTRKKL